MDSILKRGFSLFILLLVFTCKLQADINTPGAIHTIASLPGFSYHYDTIYDVSSYSKPGQSKISISVIPDIEPVKSLQQILANMNAAQYTAKIRTMTIAGRQSASVKTRLQTNHWWIVVPAGEVNIFARIESTADSSKLKENIEQLIESIKFTPFRYPANVSGNYSTDSRYSGNADSSFSVYGETGVTLNPDGSIRSSSYSGLSGSNISSTSQSNRNTGWWQVRGNRLLGYRPPNQFYNYRYDAFSNGLEIHTGAKQKLLWVRQ